MVRHYRRVGILMLLAGIAHSEPYIPADDATILERAPAAAATRALDPLRQQLTADPTDLAIALQLAQGYLRIGRETADPRFTSYAQATVAPWLKGENPPAAVLVLDATVLQSSHQFNASLRMLDRALHADPDNAQAWLTKATVLQVQGKFTEARQACSHLVQTAGQTIAVSCMANVNSLNGRLEQSYRSLQRLMSASAAQPAELRGWIAGQLGEMAVRVADPQAAEMYFLAALTDTPQDIYIEAAYADLLLVSGREKEVLSLLGNNEQQDVLLLRLAIAGKRLQTRNAAAWANTFAARYHAAERGGDTSHLREYSRFLLEVHGDTPAALEAARQNWQVQREPADIHVYANAALAASLPRLPAELAVWIRDTGYEDKTLSSLAALKAAL
jgi:tetratricopeptide (TPR) repeat protein